MSGVARFGGGARFGDGARFDINHVFLVSFFVGARLHRRRQSSEVRGANVNLCQPSPCQKLKTHRIWSAIFLGGAPNSHFKKMCGWEGRKDPKGPRSFTEGLPE